MHIFLEILAYLTLSLAFLSACVFRAAFFFPVVPFLPQQSPAVCDTVFCLSLPLAFIFAYRLCQRDKAGFVLLHVSFILPAVAIIAGAEWYFRRQAPPWPAIILHGVDPKKGADGWGRIIELDPMAVKLNSWGQRDKERQFAKTPGSTRFLFVGDSFLEESSRVPVSLLVEEKFPGHEIINLGVSTASPSDYYWRIKRFGLSLQPDEVFLFFFLGNDFMGRSENSLKSQILSVPPADSLAAKVLPGINFRLKGSQMVPSRAWYRGTPKLHDAEQGQIPRCRSLGLNRTAEFLVSFSSADRKELAQKLATKDLEAIHRIMCSPDGGLFRSYYLGPALDGVMDPSYRNPSLQPEVFEYTYRWLLSVRELCRNAGVKFHVVLVPTGFAADNKMKREWSALADMAAIFSGEHDSHQKLRERLERDQISTIDLLPSLSAAEGTYLNLDGHWSESGNRIAAETISESIRSASQK